MLLTEQLKIALSFLSETKSLYAICGGIAADFYRDEVRATADIDIAVAGDFSEKTAKDLIKHCNLIPRDVTKAELEGGPIWAVKRKSTPVQIIVGLPRDNRKEVPHVDLILPTLEWVEDAVIRAQDNRYQMVGFSVPIVRREDLLLSKLTALRNRAHRKFDFEDLRSILLASEAAKESSTLDDLYLAKKLGVLGLTFPKELEQYLSTSLGRVNRRIRRQVRSEQVLTRTDNQVRRIDR